MIFVVLLAVMVAIINQPHYDRQKAQMIAEEQERERLRLEAIENQPTYLQNELEAEKKQAQERVVERMMHGRQ